MSYPRLDVNLVTTGCCGNPYLDTEVRLVDPESKATCPYCQGGTTGWFCQQSMILRKFDTGIDGFRIGTISQMINDPEKSTVKKKYEESMLGPRIRNFFATVSHDKNVTSSYSFGMSFKRQ
jgi:hypothetical protein